MPCFNGAAADQPRKGHVCNERRGPCDASMEPRLISRGRPQHGKALYLAKRGFNGAAADQPRKAREGLRVGGYFDELQWSRG